MANSGIDIRNIALLDELVTEFERAGDQMSHIDADVRVYLGSVRDDLQRQLDVIQDRLRDAEQRLSSARSALSACQAVAAAASAMGMCQTCVFEEQEVSMAQMNVEKWQTRYSQGQQILSQCQQEISSYESGAHQLVERMCNEHTPQATQQLNCCIDMLQDILNSDMGMVYAKSADTSQTAVPKANPMTTANDTRFDDFRKSLMDNASAGEKTSQMSHSGSLLRPARFK